MRDLIWVSSCLRDLKALPNEIQQEFGYALHIAQIGDKHPSAKPLRGFRGASVLEIVASDAAGTYRAMYTVQFEDAVYVLHVFQKKSTSGIATSKQDLDLIKSRLKQVKERQAKCDQKKRPS